MRAMILAAGLGTRLKEISVHTPKCLIEAGGKTMLEHVVGNLKSAGVTELVINLCHLGDKIEKFVRAHDSFGIKVSFSYEKEPLGTGGGVKQAAELLKDAPYFILHNGDIYSDIDLKGLVEYHLKEKPLATLAVMERKTSRYVLFDKSKRLVGWDNPKENESQNLVVGELVDRLAFSGIQILTPRILDYMKEEKGLFNIFRSYMKAAEAGERILGYRMDGAYWMDVGTPETLDALRKHLS